MGLKQSRERITFQREFTPRNEVLGPAEHPPLSATTTGKSGPARRPMVFVCPLIVPPTSSHPPARSGGLRCEFGRAGKFICMGNRKNRLTTTKLISRHARTRLTWSEFGPRRRGQTPPALLQRPQRSCPGGSCAAGTSAGPGPRCRALETTAKPAGTH